MEAGGYIYALATLPPVKKPLVLTEWEAGWASEPVCILRRRENILHLPQKIHTMLYSVVVCWSSFL